MLVRSDSIIYFFIMVVELGMIDSMMDLAVMLEGYWEVT